MKLTERFNRFLEARGQASYYWELYNLSAGTNEKWAQRGQGYDEEAKEHEEAILEALGWADEYLLAHESLKLAQVDDEEN